MASKEIQEIVDQLTAMEDAFFHKLVQRINNNWLLG